MCSVLCNRSGKMMRWNDRHHIMWRGNPRWRLMGLRLRLNWNRKDRSRRLWEWMHRGEVKVMETRPWRDSVRGRMMKVRRSVSPNRRKRKMGRRRQIGRFMGHLCRELRWRVW